ncbi:hypothetical protein [Leifsonia xyli]|nr:hypothetical protein [Leifsonia xyli]
MHPLLTEFLVGEQLVAGMQGAADYRLNPAFDRSAAAFDMSCRQVRWQ